MAKTPKKIDIFVIPIEGIDVRFTYSNNIISYFFVYDGKNYGNALNILQSDKKRATLTDCIQGGAMLMMNAVDSVKNIIKENNAQ